MGRKPREIPAVVAALGERIEEWREKRTKGTRMPEELWGTATQAASLHGVCFVSRSLRLSCHSLRRRVEDEGEEPTNGVNGFVELDARKLLGSQESLKTVLELSRPDGACVRLQVSGHTEFDMLALARALWDHDR